MFDITFSPNHRRHRLDAPEGRSDGRRLRQRAHADELRRSFENSAVVAFARHNGRVIGKARAPSDGVCNALRRGCVTHSGYRRRASPHD